MKTHLLIWLAAPLFWLSACTQVYFSEAPPRGLKALEEVPAELYGTYQVMGESPGNQVVIDREGFLLKEPKQGVLAWEARDPQLVKMEGSQLWMRENAEYPWQPATYDRTGDSLKYAYVSMPPKLMVGDSVVLKHWRGSYFLSLREENPPLRYVGLHLQTGEEKGVWTLHTIDLDEEKAALETATKMTAIKDEAGEVQAYHINPSRKELLQFLQAGGFSEEVLTLKRIE